jgi:hypothetical protein
MYDNENPYINDEEPNNNKSRLGVIALIISIVSLALMAVPFVGSIIAIVAIILSSKALKSTNKKGMPSVSLAISIISLVISLIYLLLISLASASTLNVLDSTKRKSFDIQAQTVADWVEKEYQKSLLSISSSEFTSFCGEEGIDCQGNTVMFRVTGGSDILTASGVDANNFDLINSTLSINSNGKACVILYGSSNGTYSNYTKEKLDKLGEEPSKSSACE